jgi:hypothetical protein
MLEWNTSQVWNATLPPPKDWNLISQTSVLQSLICVILEVYIYLIPSWIFAHDHWIDEFEISSGNSRIFFSFFVVVAIDLLKEFDLIDFCLIIGYRLLSKLFVLFTGWWIRSSCMASISPNPIFVREEVLWGSKCLAGVFLFLCLVDLFVGILYETSLDLHMVWVPSFLPEFWSLS